MNQIRVFPVYFIDFVPESRDMGMAACGGAVDDRGQVRRESDTTLMPKARGRSGEAVAFHTGPRSGELPSPAGIAQGGQVLWLSLSLQVKLIKIGGRLGANYQGRQKRRQPHYLGKTITEHRLRPE